MLPLLVLPPSRCATKTQPCMAHGLRACMQTHTGALRAPACKDACEGRMHARVSYGLRPCAPPPMHTRHVCACDSLMDSRADDLQRCHERGPRPVLQAAGVHR